MNHLVQAKADGLLWIIVGVFWVVAQIAGAAAKKKAPLRQPVASDESINRPKDPMAELVRKWAGVEPDETPQPEYEDEAEEISWKPEEIQALPDMGLLGRQPANPVEKFSVPPAVLPAAVRPTMKAFRHSIPSLKLPTLHLSFNPARKGSVIRNGLQMTDPSSLRHAMLNHLILGKPKGLEGWNTGTPD